MATAVLVIATLILAYVQGAPSERQRRRWIFLLLGARLVAVAIDIGVQNTVGLFEIVDNVTLALRDLAASVGHALDAMRVRELEERITQLETARHHAV